MRKTRTLSAWKAFQLLWEPDNYTLELALKDWETDMQMMRDIIEENDKVNK